MWPSFTFCWGGWMAKADTAPNSTGASSALPVAGEAEQISHQPVPTSARAFPTQETHLSMGLSLSRYLCV